MKSSRDPDEKPALVGGPPAKKTPFPPRKRHGDLEKQLLAEVVDSDILFYFIGTKVHELQRRFAETLGMKHCIACSSGTAAMHIAVGALQLPHGSEVITNAITDMGTVTGMLYQGLVPVFADVDPETLNLSPQSVRERLTERTSAIVVVHHSGLSADLEPILEIASARGIPVVEDCAQAYGCEYQGRPVGTFGRVAAFSLNHFKHITCGSGGMVVTNDDRIRYIASLFVDKCFQREEKIRNPFFLAPNYQMTELQGAVALAQLSRVEEITASRNRLGALLNELLADAPGVSPQPIPEGSRHTYFMYPLRLDLELLGCTAREFSEALVAEGIPNEAHQITGGRPLYLYDLFQNRSAFPGSKAPFVSAETGSNRVYQPGDCPVAEEAYRRWLILNVYERYRELDIEEIAWGIRKVARYHLRGTRD